jgi:cephalosporin hydroxylase
MLYQMYFRVLLIALFVILSACQRKPRPAPHLDAAGARLGASEISIGDPVFQPLLLRGLYESEGGWRWTARKFAVAITPPAGKDATSIVLEFNLPIEVTRTIPAIVLTSRVNGVEVGHKRYTGEGRHEFSAPVPDRLLAPNQPAEVEFELDRAARDDGHNRELGVIALSAALTHAPTARFDREEETARARQGYEYLLARRNLVATPEKQNEMMKLFHEIPVWQHMFFYNVQIEKNPLDLWMMQQIIYETRPDFIVETGTWRGGSALYWAHTLNGAGLEQSRVITVDVQDLTRQAAAHPLWKKYVTFFQGSSTDADIVSRIAALTRGKKVLVTLDSDHSMGHVLNELHAYSPLVASGSYLVVEDTHMDGVPTAPEFGPGPLAAVRKFLEEGGARQFTQDLTREAYMMTFNPGGWLLHR